MPTTDQRLLIADSRDLSTLDGASAHLVVTSPPYWQLKDYGHEGQIGYHQTYAEYVDSLNLVWSECARVLHPGCRMCVDVGDQFARAAVYGRYKLIPIQAEVIRFLETIGLDYMGTIVWQKVTTTHTTGGASIMGSFPYPRNGMVKIDYEHILLFKKPGEPPKPSPEAKERARLTIDEWNAYFSGHWKIPGVRQEKHLAAFPEDIPARLIRMFTFEGETVLDPFAGSGTTLVAAHRLGRSGVGVELNADFEQLVRERLAGACCPEFSVRHIPHLAESAEGQSKIGPTFDIREAIARLPYRYEDPHGLEKLSDPKGFRSRVAL